VEDAEDLLAMRRLMEGLRASGERPRWIEDFADAIDTGVSVIDRNFRIWYRNLAHKRIAGKRSPCPLCWVCYHGLTDRTSACPQYPSAKMFESGEVQPNPVRMLIGFEPGDDRPARPTEVRALPLREEGGRIVGAMEILTDTMAQLNERSLINVEEWLSAILTRVFLTKFGRARLFLLSPSREQLLGCVAVGDPPLGIPVTAMTIPVQTDPPTLPEQPTVRHIGMYRPNQVHFHKEIDKGNAPYWADFPLHDETGSVLGKVIVDNWSRKESERVIHTQDLEGFQKGIAFISEVLTKASAINAQREQIAAAEALGSLLNRAQRISGVDQLYDALLEVSTRVPGVLSAVVRERCADDAGAQVFRKLKGKGAYYEHCIRDLPVEEKSITRAAYWSRDGGAIAITTPETLRLEKGSIELVEPESHRDELRRIRFQGTFALGNRAPGRETLLSVQTTSSSCFDNRTILYLARASEWCTDSVSLHDAWKQLCQCFLSVMRMHDVDTAVHSERVADVAAIIAGAMDNTLRERAFLAGALHDIGKIGLERGLLRGHSPLSPAEWWTVKAHVELGSDVLRDFTEMQDIRAAVRQHHMWFDGTNGYPEFRPDENASKPTISLLGRIVALADCFEAMTSPARYYQEALNATDALDQIARSAGTQFCPSVVEVFRSELASIVECVFAGRAGGRGETAPAEKGGRRHR